MQALKLFCFVLGLSTFNAAQADIIAVKGGIDYWHYNADLQQPTSVGAQAELENDHSMSFSIAVEHPVPFLPNIKIKHTDLQAESNQSFSGLKHHQVDLDYSDFILYYEILDNIISADIGFGAKRLEGTLRQNDTQTQDISGTIPMVYAQAGAKLPFTGLSAGAEVSFSSLDHDKITDAQAELKYNFIDTLLVDVGAKVGYRILDIQLDEGSNQEAKLKFKGPYFGIDVNF